MGSRMGRKYLVNHIEGMESEITPLISSVDLEEANLGHSGAGIAPSVFNLANSIIGAGILSLPFAFSLTGWGLGAIVLVLTVAGADFTIRLLLKCGEASQRRTYEGVAEAAFGRKGVWFVSVAVILLNIGALTAYFVILGDVLPPLWHKAVKSDDFVHGDRMERFWCTGVVTLVILVPLGLLKSVSNLAFTSTLSLCCVLSFTVIMAVLASEGPERHADYDAEAEPPTAFRFHIDIFRAFSLLAFAFTCHSVVFPVYLELRQPSVKRMMTVTHWSMIICFAFYLCVAYCGYDRYQRTIDGVEGDVLNNVHHENNVIATIVQCAYAVSIISTYPMGLAPIRQALAGLCYDNEHPTKWPWPRHIAISLGVIGLTFVFALYIPVLDFVFGLTGATAGVSIVYILPPAMTLKLRDDLSEPYRLFLSIFMVLGMGLGILASVFTVLDHIHNKDT
eukprot:TRINITY_DN8285_c0_g1_i2.p1 TRINITY_DN8285_c0_g1~~TRINITY_DN8285_c0_g1_i2.p1  ORF type:complete len:449 (+),score=61.81 TRINITY_DN8285_c0_g1_i2:224-1570(+)